MSSFTLPNAAPGKRSVGNGSGVTRQKLPFGHVTVRGSAGDVHRLVATDYTNNFGSSGLVIQASAGSAKIYGTLADPSLARNPEQDAGDHWIELGTAAPGAFLVPDNFVVALKIEFISDAIVYVVNT